MRFTRLSFGAIGALVLNFTLFAPPIFGTDDTIEISDTLEADPDASPITMGFVPQILLRVGERYPLEQTGQASADSLRISPQSVASIKNTASGPVILAHAPGRAQLLVEANDGAPAKIDVVVREKLHKSTAPGDATLVGAIRGAKLRSLGGQKILEGVIEQRESYRNLLLLLRTKPKITVLATTTTALRESLALQAKQLLEKNGLDRVDITHAGNRFFIDGQVATPEQVDQAYELASSVIPNIENHLQIPMRITPSITVRVFLLELTRSAHEVLGLRWPGLVAGAGVVSPSSIAFGPKWSADLLHLARRGEAKVLAEPLLALKSGSAAELAAGGEIPLRVTGRYENKVVWKHYGLKLKVHIAGIAGNVIRAKIETSTSSLDEASAIDGIPGIRRNSLSTEIDAVENKPILLTGLFHASQSKDIEKLPILGDIPLLGELFKSRRFQNRESELLVAFLPRFGVEHRKTPLDSERGLNFDTKWRILD
ncbi:MAG TPA: hypothetical protein PLH57_01305 [Oligoflexia bacterium]|nr:hypothetical protein [Oligoflexia bacterium]